MGGIKGQLVLKSIPVDELIILCYDDVMSKMGRFKDNQAIRETTLIRSQRAMFSLVMLTVVLAIVAIGILLFAPSLRSWAEIKIDPPAVSTVGPILVVSEAIDPTKPLVGIVSGHKGYDPGAVCPDGLSETDINYTIAGEVVSLLNRRGIQAHLLEEYDDRLTEYQADALVSVHADSCNIPGASGFKVARVTHSAIPDAEDRLVACLNQEYATYTGLPQHFASITDGMTDYHAFNEIAPHTPGAIIEVGFLLDDRFLLESKPKIVARGIAAGIICFLETE